MSRKNWDHKNIHQRLYSRRPLDVLFDDPIQLSMEPMESSYRNGHLGWSENDLEQQGKAAEFWDKGQKKYFFDTKPNKIKPTNREIKKARRENK